VQKPTEIGHGALSSLAEGRIETATISHIEPQIAQEDDGEENQKTEPQALSDEGSCTGQLLVRAGFAGRVY